MATTSTNTTKAALLQGIPPSSSPATAASKPPKPARAPKPETRPALGEEGKGARAKPIPEPNLKAVSKDQNFEQSGAFNINDQWSTAVRYDAKMIDGQVSELSVKFTNGRKQVAAVDFKSRALAVDVLGERNVANIEAGLGRDTAQDRPPVKADMQTDLDGVALDAGTSYSKGRLQAEHLAFKKAYTLDRKPENIIEPDTTRDAQLESDAEVRTWVAGRREQLDKQLKQNDQANDGKTAETGPQAEPGRAGAASDKSTLDKDVAAAPTGPGAAGKDDRKNAVPEHVSKRFLQADDKYYFPDKTFAFEDRGAKLATNSENQEVVRSLIAIAQARGWDHITVRGSEEFRRSAWLEASTQGIEVRGYKPTAVEKAHLASILDKDGERGADLPNSISKGRERNVDKQQAPNAPETAQTAPQGVKTPTVAARPGATVGKLLDHGEADYQNDPKKEKSYFVTVETARGPKTVWGVDLDRAMSESGVQLGENISLEKLGKEPVTAKEKVFDKAGNQVGTRDVAAERNKWLVGSMDKAYAFATGERAEVVAKHPDLASAYGTMAVARKLAEQEWPDNKELQRQFIAATHQVLADKIATGEDVPAPKIRETRTKEQDKQAGKELERERG